MRDPNRRRAELCLELHPLRRSNCSRMSRGRLRLSLLFISCHPVCSPDLRPQRVRRRHRHPSRRRRSYSVQLRPCLADSAILSRWDDDHFHNPGNDHYIVITQQHAHELIRLSSPSFIINLNPNKHILPFNHTP